MRKSFFSLSLTAALAVLMLSGCASSPGVAPAKTGEEPPQWVLNPPEGDENYMYFTGSGTSNKGDLSEAEEAGRGALLDEIMRYLGVRITSETTATVRATIDSYQTDVIQQLKSTSSGRVTGLEIAEKWADRRGQAATLYLLARYDKADLLKEKQRLEEIFQEKIEAVSGPEREAEAQEARGRHYQAALSYMEAAAAAFKSEIENADIKFERNINRAKDSIRRIALVKMNDNLKADLGGQFSESFDLKVVDGSSADDRGVPGVAIQVVYKELRSSGKKVIRSKLIKTDEAGVAGFIHPAPTFVGKGEVSMALYLGEALESLQDVPKKLIEQVDGLEELILKKKVSFSFESVSLAGRISTGVAIFCLDASGNPISLTDTQAGVLERLTRAGFNVKNLPVAVTSIAGRQDSQVIPFLKRNFTGQVERAIYGTARISDHEQEGEYVIIQVTGSFKVVELSTEKILLTVSKSKRAQGTNASAALSAAFKKLGEDVGQTILNQLK